MSICHRDRSNHLRTFTLHRIQPEIFRSLGITNPPLQPQGKPEIMPLDSATGVSAVFVFGKLRLEWAV